MRQHCDLNHFHMSIFLYLLTTFALLAGLSCFGFVACLFEPGIVR